MADALGEASHFLPFLGYHQFVSESFGLAGLLGSISSDWPEENIPLVWAELSTFLEPRPSPLLAPKCLCCGT